MDALTLINRAIVSVGIPTIVAALIYIGRKLQVIDTLERVIEREIKPDLKDIRERFFATEGKVDEFVKSRSPLSLTEKGEVLIQESGLKAYIDENKDELLKLCPPKEMTNPYEVQEFIFSMFHSYEFDDETDDKLKRYAYEKGLDMALIRRTGAIYFRDIYMKEHGMES